MTDAERSKRYRKGEAYAALKDTPEFRASKAERLRKWRRSSKGKAWLRANYVRLKKSG